MNDLDRAKAALKAGNAEHATALALIVIAENLQYLGYPQRYVVNSPHDLLHEEPYG